MAIVTGGTPRTVGAYYDVAYDRVLAPPATTTGNGLESGPCTRNVPNGTTTEYEEGIEIPLIPTNLRDPFHGCAPVDPWNFVRTNTIYGVIRSAGGYTAWSDKHPAYSSVAGPGDGKNVDDYYSPEINSTAVGLPGAMTPTGVSCEAIRDSSQTGAWTNSFDNVQCYDSLKVKAI